MKRKSTRLMRFGFLLLSFIFYSTQFSNAQERTNLEKLNLPFQVNFTEKEIKSLNSLSPADLEKLNKVIELIRSYGARSQNTTDTCTTEVCKKQKLIEKCRKENSISAFPKSEECKSIDPIPTAQQIQLQKDLLAEKAMLADKSHDANVDRMLKEVQTNPPPSVPQSVINQDPKEIKNGQSVFLGDFVCKQDGGGSFNTRERPKNQGGLVQDELFYAIANAAKASGVSLTSLGCHNNRNIAGTNIASQHSSGSACDVLPKGQDSQKTAFVVFFLANTGNFNTVGSYASRRFDHSHLGGDCGGTWCPYQKGSGLEPWKELAIRTVFQACGQTWNAGSRPAKKWVQDCAKKAVDKFCQSK